MNHCRYMAIATPPAGHEVDSGAPAVPGLGAFRGVAERGRGGIPELQGVVDGAIHHR